MRLSISSQFLLWATISAGCAGMSPPPVGHVAELDQLRRNVPAPPDAVVRAAVAVFAELGVTVAVVSPETGVATSAETTVRDAWGDSPVRNRVYCGKYWDSGVEVALSQPVRFTLGITASPMGSGSSVALTFNGHATPATRAIGSDTTYPCQLTASFAGEVLSAIVARATAAPAS